MLMKDCYKYLFSFIAPVNSCVAGRCYKYMETCRGRKLYSFLLLLFALVCSINGDAQVGIINTIAGNGIGGFSGDGGPATSAKLNFPIGVKMDATGNIYIADQYNYCIRKINTYGIITTIAGTAKTGLADQGRPVLTNKGKPVLFDHLQPGKNDHTK